MPAFSVFTDESGRFAPADALGRRVTAAVVLPGLREEAESRLRAGLEALTHTVGLPFHATEMLHPRDLAKRLRQHRDSWPLLPMSPALTALLASRRAVREDFRNDPALRDLWQELQAVGTRILDRIRTSMHVLLGEGGFAVVCVARGPAAPGQDAWGEAMAAVLTEALVRLALRPGGAHDVEVVPVRRGDEGMTVDVGPVVDCLEAAHANTGRVHALRPVRRTSVVVGAEESLGIQLADVVAHALGPGSAQDKAVPDAVACSLDFATFRQDARLKFGEPFAARVDCAGAGRVHAEVWGAVVDAAEGRPTHRRDTLNAYLRRLPADSYPCAIEGSLAVVDALSGAAR